LHYKTLLFDHLKMGDLQDLDKYPVAIDKDAMSLEGDTGVSSDDALRLAQLGHTQELRRQYSLFSLCALCVCLMATWEALSSVVATALITGGAPCLFYN
jgi:choline transport protein